MFNLFRKTKELITSRINPMNGVYMMHSIRSFAGSLIGIYVPIYLLKLGFSITDVFVFWLIYSISVFVFCAVAAYISKKVGLKKIIVASLFLQFAYLYILHRLKFLPVPIPLVSIVSGLQAAFYWFPINVFFSHHSDVKEMGGNVGKLFALPKIIKLPEPILAALIIVKFGFDALFILSAIIYVISLIPLISVPELKGEISFNINKYWGLFKKYTRYFAAEFMENIREEAEGIILPIFIFLTFKDIISVGVVSTFASLGGIIFSLIIGKLSDSSNKKVLMRVGVLVMIAAWIVRIFVPNQLVFYAISFVVGFVEILVLVPFTSIIYTSAKQENPAEFLLFREMSVGAARVFVYIIAILLASNILYTFALPIFSLISFLFY
jgi:MFS family permease